MTVDKKQMLPIGTLLKGGEYKVESYLASGGFGNTYEVMHLRLGKRMAMKEFFMSSINMREGTKVSVSIDENRSTFEQMRDKFYKEAHRLAHLEDNHIVEVSDFFEENQTAYYIMKLIDGQSLSTKMKNNGTPFTETQVREVLTQVFSALKCVHHQGIYHLDLKPANIMQRADGHCWLIDFGASKQLLTKEGEAVSTSTGLCYTPGYAPSEQINGNIKRIGAWTDIYALGATLYNLLTYQTPPSPDDIMNEGIAAFAFPNGISSSMRELIVWLMQPRPADRPQSIEAIFERQNKNADDSKTVEATPTKITTPSPFPTKPKYDKEESAYSDDESPKRYGKWIVIALIAIALIGIGTYFFLNRSSDEQEEIVEIVEDGSRTLCGTIGDIPITMELHIDDPNVDGSIYYNKYGPSNKLFVSGSLNDNEIELTEHNKDGMKTGRYKGKYSNGVFQGEFINYKGDTYPFSLSEMEEGNKEMTESKDISAGLTFRIFTESTIVEWGGNKHTVQETIGNRRIAANLLEIGFTLLERKTENRLDYTGDEYYDVTIETYSKTINGYSTTVKLEEDFTEIHFPNLNDVEEFKLTVINSGMKDCGDKYVDDEEVYWAGTDVTIKGTVVTLKYRWEP